MHWIIGIFMGFMALLSHQKAVQPVATSTPVIIEAPKGVVLGGVSVQAGRPAKIEDNNTAIAQVVLPSATTTSFVNPNTSFMEVHGGAAGSAVVAPAQPYLIGGNNYLYPDGAY